MSTSRLRPLRPAGIALALALLGGCFEPPVRETLLLHFLPDGSLAVTSTVEVAANPQEPNPELDRRLAQTRQELLDGTDAWSRRFARLEPGLERFSWEKHLGELTRAERSALLGDPADVGSLLSDTPLSVSYAVTSGVAELTIIPGSPDRASRAERQAMERELDAWTAGVAEYLAAGADLWAWLDEHPGRARACLGAVFEEAISDADREHLGKLGAGEQRKVDRLRAAMERVWGAMIVDKDRELTLDELSHRVYDPLPALLRIQLPSPALEVEGFAAAASAKDAGTLEAEGPGLWNALRGLEGRWLAPDLVLEYVARGGASAEEPLDLDALARRPRRAAAHPPDADEVRKAIEERLQGERIYRATWKAPEPVEER